MPSSSLASASIKSIRLYRHICRMIPYILKIHEMYITKHSASIEPHPSRPRSTWRITSELTLISLISQRSTDRSILDMKCCMMLNGISLKQAISINTLCRPREFSTISVWTDLTNIELRKPIEKVQQLPS